MRPPTAADFTLRDVPVGRQYNTSIYRNIRPGSGGTVSGKKKNKKNHLGRSMRRNNNFRGRWWGNRNFIKRTRKTEMRPSSKIVFLPRRRDGTRVPDKRDADVVAPDAGRVRSIRLCRQETWSAIVASNDRPRGLQPTPLWRGRGGRGNGRHGNCCNGRRRRRRRRLGRVVTKTLRTRADVCRFRTIVTTVRPTVNDGGAVVGGVAAVAVAGPCRPLLHGPTDAATAVWRFPARGGNRFPPPPRTLFCVLVQSAWRRLRLQMLKYNIFNLVNWYIYNWTPPNTNLEIDYSLGANITVQFFTFRSFLIRWVLFWYIIVISIKLNRIF